MPDRVWMPAAAWMDMVAAARDAAPLETGGCLVGYRVKETAETVIVSIVGPGPNARATTNSFEPDYEFQQAEIQRHYAASERLHTYLGDWHSHPGGTTAMSRMDRIALRKIARTAEARQSNPLMVIVAEGDPWKLCVWRRESAMVWPRHRRLEVTFY